MPKHAIEVHRGLHLTSPIEKGPDVEALQRACNDLFEKMKLDFLKIRVDGNKRNGGYGQQSFHAARMAAFALGLSGEKEEGGRTSEKRQHLIRNPRDRTAADRKREKARKPKLQALRKAQKTGAAAAVKWAVDQVGTDENPAGSNTGPKIDEWQSYWGLHAAYWCGIFAGYAVKKIGGGQTDCWLPYGPSIINDAQAGRNGLRAVPVADAQPGDLVVYWGGEHIGLIRAASRAGSVQTVEGNTSASDGSQSNGGTVALKSRPFSDVTVVARVTDWK